MGRLGVCAAGGGACRPLRSGVRRLAPSGAIALLMALAMLVSGSHGCASHSRGFYHRVQAGENLYRIGRRYGVEAELLARVNRIRDVTQLETGRRIWIPRSHARPPTPPAGRAKPVALSEAKLAFVWPLKGGKLTSRFGPRNGRPHEGVDLAAARGAKIRAAESGKVIHSGRLGDYGNVVIVKHTGHYRSVYAHARKLLVRKGEFVDKGQLIAEVGTSGNARGPHLHFEIRQRETPRDPMRYLP